MPGNPSAEMAAAAKMTMVEMGMAAAVEMASAVKVATAVTSAVAAAMTAPAPRHCRDRQHGRQQDDDDCHDWF